MTGRQASHNHDPTAPACCLFKPYLEAASNGYLALCRLDRHHHKTGDVHGCITLQADIGGATTQQENMHGHITVQPHIGATTQLKNVHRHITVQARNGHTTHQGTCLDKLNPQSGQGAVMQSPSLEGQICCTSASCASHKRQRFVS